MKDLKEKIFARLNEFSWSQMTSNGNGKTSGSGTSGVVTIAVGLLCFLIGTVDFALSKEPKPDIMMYSTGIITIGSGLLGYRKSKDKIELEKDEE